MFEITANVTGMMCEKCEARATESIREALDVKKVKASHETDTIVITATQDISKQQIIDALSPTKFTCNGVESVEKEVVENAGGLFGFLK